MTNEFESVSVIGLGYVGLPTACILASRGINVLGVDVNERAVRTINEGKLHFVEPELEALVQGVVANKKLRASLKPEPAGAFVIAVPTPILPDHRPDLAFVRAAAKAIAPSLKRGNLIILESTSPVGTTESLAAWLAEDRPDLKFPHRHPDNPDIHMAYCPERVLPGQVLKELVSNDRVIGGITPACAEKARALYETFVRGECVITDARTAEMSKLTENSFRDVNIAFANELSMLCEKLDINVWELIRIANRHPRVNILQPGPGVGGHCIAVDPWFIVDSAPSLARLIRTAREVNDSKPHFVIEKVKEKAARFKSPVVACLGLAFKADIDDLRESPAVEVVQHLAKERVGRILAVEPHIKELPPALRGAQGVELAELHEALKAADIVLLLVNHRAFARIDRKLLSEKLLIDTRGVWA